MKDCGEGASEIAGSRSSFLFGSRQCDHPFAPKLLKHLAQHGLCRFAQILVISVRGVVATP